MPQPIAYRRRFPLTVSGSRERLSSPRDERESAHRSNLTFSGRLWCWPNPGVVFPGLYRTPERAYRRRLSRCIRAVGGGYEDLGRAYFRGGIKRRRFGREIAVP